MSPTDWEARARSIKASKLSRVLARVLDANESLTVEDLAGADEAFRLRVATLAGCNPPSEKSWSAALGLLVERAQQAAS